jgi:hypothetical protein
MVQLPTMSRLFSAIVLCLLALPAFARVRITAKYKGETVPDAEVCFYPAVFADPFAALASPEFRCLPSDTEIAIPNKSFAVFARRGTDLVTMHHAIVHASPDRQQGVATRVVSLAPAVSLNAKAILSRLGKDEHLAIILGETSQNRPTVMPLQSAGGLAPLPVGVPAVPLLIKGGQPIEVGDFLKPTSGNPAELRFSQASDGTTILVRFRAIDPLLAANGTNPSSPKLYSDAFLKLLFSQDVPVVEVIDTAGKVHQSDLKALKASNLFETVYVFRNVPPGKVRIRTGGSSWQTTEQAIEIRPRQSVATPEPVLLRLGANVHVSLDNSFQLPKTVSTCGTESGGEKRDTRSVGLFQCQRAMDRATLTPEVLARCTPLGSQEVAGNSRTPQINFDGVKAGDYLIAAKVGERVVNLELAHATLGSTTEITMPLVGNYVTGRVTRAGKPAKSEVRFLTGTAVSDPDTGEYFALLSKPHRAHVGVQVIACDEAFVYMRAPAADIENGARYDIEIPSNEIIVDVLEKNTGKKLEGASVIAAIVRLGESRSVVGQMPAEVRNERYVVGSLDEGSTVSICARLSGYQYECTDDLEVRRGTQRASLYLTPTPHKARTAGTGYTRAFWAGADGTVTEDMAIDEKGEFQYSGEHLYEHLILVGTAPLWVTTPQTWTADELVLTPPQGPVRTVTFKLSERNPHKTSTVLLWVNDLAVPRRALFLHQLLRGRPWLIIDRSPLVVSDLFESDTMLAAEGPDPDTLESGSAVGVTSYSSTRRLPVVGAEVIF